MCTCAHTHTHSRTCAHSPPSELLTFSSRLIAIDICLLSCACSRVGADGNGWCYCWRRKREGRGKKRWRGWMWWSGWWRGGSWKEVDCGRQAPHAAPGIHLDPLLPGKVTGRLSLTSSLQRSRRCDLRLFSYNMAFSVTQPVTSPHCLQPSRKGRTVCNVRPSSLSILIDVWIKMCMTNVVAALSLSLKTGDGTEGLHLVGCFQLLAEKQDALLLYRGSLLVAERGRAVKKTSFSVWKWGWTTCAQLK